MESEFITFRTFDDEALANILGEQLGHHHIDYTIEEEAQLFNGSSIYTTGMKKYAVKISADKFEKANEVLLEDEAKEIDHINNDYYLLEFTNVELLDLLSKADEWNSFDVALAKKLLNERGMSITDKDIHELNDKRIKELSKPEPSQKAWIMAGYVTAFLGGALGIFIGWHLANHKKTLPNGEKVFGYTEHDRKQGRIIFILSIVLFTAVMCLRIWASFDN